jgi:DNA mismatch endonuclease (patch repair protein)
MFPIGAVMSSATIYGSSYPVESPADQPRSELMARVAQRNTRPEMAVRRVAHALGYRFRLHRRDLPGSPDIVFPSRRKVIFVHGCFWHRHEGCRKATTPKRNSQFWLKKFSDNERRDSRDYNRLKAIGWDVLIIWECETKDGDKLARVLRGFLTD